MNKPCSKGGLERGMRTLCALCKKILNLWYLFDSITKLYIYNYIFISIYSINVSANPLLYLWCCVCVWTSIDYYWFSMTISGLTCFNWQSLSHFTFYKALGIGNITDLGMYRSFITRFYLNSWNIYMRKRHHISYSFLSLSYKI